MALKPTILKLKIMLSDLDRNLFETLNLTVAQHPSETSERMMVRVLAFCINSQEQLEFGKGLSDADEPDIWAKTLDGRISLWIDVGEPAYDRIKKASSISDSVKIYSFNSKSDAWWSAEKASFAKSKAEVFQVDWQQTKQLAKLVERNMDFTVTITEGSAYFASEEAECEISWTPLSQ